MFCTKCGKEIENSSEFCVHCGSKVETQTGAPQQQAQPQYAPAKKSNKGLIIGLIAGAAVIAIVLILVFVVFPGGSSDLLGTWYDEYGYSTMDFMGGGKCKMSAMGLFNLEGEYTYDEDTKKGTITLSAFGETNVSEFYIENGILFSEDGTKYSRTQTDQKDFGDMFGDLDFGGLEME